jgi:hypothetical protein
MKDQTTMAHNLDMTNGRANIAYLGSRNDVWHRLGQEMTEGMSIDQWAAAAGLNWDAVKVPALADLSGAQFDDQFSYAGQVSTGEVRHKRARDRSFMVRSDTGAMLGDQVVSDVYQPVQPREVLEWFQQYIGVDERFKLDVAGSLKGGSIIWVELVHRGVPSQLGRCHTLLRPYRCADRSGL